MGFGRLWNLVPKRMASLGPSRTDRDVLLLGPNSRSIIASYFRGEYYQIPAFSHWHGESRLLPVRERIPLLEHQNAALAVGTTYEDRFIPLSQPGIAQLESFLALIREDSIPRIS